MFTNVNDFNSYICLVYWWTVCSHGDLHSGPASPYSGEQVDKNWFKCTLALRGGGPFVDFGIKYINN